MSIKRRYIIDISREIKRQQYLTRIETNTLRFFEKYRNMYNTMISQGLCQYIPDELSRIESYLSEIGNLLNNEDGNSFNIEEANRLSKELGPYIMSVRDLAWEMKQKERENRERLREEIKRCKSEMWDIFHEQLKIFHDPSIRSYAQPEVSKFKDELKQKEITVENMKNIKQIILNRFEAIYENASHKADEWKEKKRKESEEAMQKKLARLYEEQEEIRNQEAKKQENLNRIREKTEDFYHRYLQIYEDMISQQINEQLSNEMERFKQYLSEVNGLLFAGKIELARAVNLELGEYIHEIMPLAHEIKKELRTKEKNEEYSERTYNNTVHFLEKFTKSYNKMLERGFYEYVPAELDKIKDNLQEIKQCLKNGRTEEAKKLSFTLSSFIDEAWVLGGKLHRENREQKKTSVNEKRKNEQEEIQQQRISHIIETTRSYYNKYASIYEDMIARGFEKYIKNDLDRVYKNLTAIKNHLDRKQHEEARALSLELGGVINEVRDAGFKAFREEKREENIRIKAIEQESETCSLELIDFLDEKIKESLQDSVSRDFAYEEINKLKAEISKYKITTSELNETKTKIDLNLSIIVNNAKKKAKAWVQEKKKQSEEQAHSALIDMHKEMLQEDEKHNPEAITKIISNLDELKQSLTQKTTLSTEELNKKINEEMERADSVVLDKEKREEALKQIRRSLNEQGFIINKSERILKNGEDYYIISAKKPSGKTVLCSVSLAGELMYKFDKYEAMTCMQDVEPFTKKLQEIYGIKLSDERVLWENPDKIGKDQKDNPLDDQIRRTY